MLYLYVLTALLLTISFIINREKTLQSVKIAARKLVGIMPAFLTMLIIVSVSLFLIPDEVILSCLGSKNSISGVLLASFLGSITLMPGFIAFPLCGILLKKGVLYMVLSAFSTTLMMVGIITYPVEREYFGVKVTIVRNVMSFFIALVVALMIGIFFGEVF